MTRRVPLLLALTLAAAQAVVTQASAAPAGRGATVVCLDPSGATRGPICRSGSMWSRDDICRCPAATVQVDASWCAPHETPAPDSRAANEARRRAARDGSLVGASFEGRRFCVPAQSLPR